MAARSKKDAAVAEQLRLAGAALAGGDGEAALEALLAAWRQRRAPQLSAAITRLSERLTIPAVSEATDPKVRMLAWAERAQPRRAVDVGPLLADAEEQLPVVQAHFSLNRVKLLRAFAPDARIGRFADWALKHAPRFRHHPPKLTTALTALAKAHGDDADAPAELIDTLAPQLAALAASKVALRPLEIYVARPGSDSVAALLAAVYADPDNDELRQVCGDRLSELGDPRGEFIALSYRARAGALDAAGDKRLAALQRKHGDAWLGGMASLVVKKNVVFARGFPARAHCMVNRVFKRKQAVLLPEWSTLEELDFSDLSFVTPTMKCLRVARNLDDAGVRELAALAQPPPLEVLAVRLRELAEPPPAEWSWLPLLARLPRLAQLDVVCWESIIYSPTDAARHRDGDYPALARALAAVLPPSCHALGLRGTRWHLEVEHLMDWVLGVLAALPPTVRTLRLGGLPEPFVSLAGDRFDTLTLHPDRLHMRRLGAVAPLLSALGGRLRCVQVAGAGATLQWAAAAVRALVGASVRVEPLPR